MQAIFEFVRAIATVVLIAVVIRWLFLPKGTELPIARNGTNVYSIKWRFRVVGYSGAIFGVIVSIWSWRDLHRPDWGVISIFSLFVVIGLWLACGSVRADEIGITKRVLLYSRSLPWCEITDVRLHMKKGGAIEVRAGSRKLIIDSRFVAFEHLCKEIADRTDVNVVRD